MLRNLLKQIGLSDKEVDVYLSSLKLGPQPASIIAKSAGLNRSTTYVILESLYQKGLISQFVKAEVKFFSVVSPENLVNYVERTINEMKVKRDEIISFIPEFLSITNKIEVKPRLMFYEGLPFVQEIYNEMSRLNDSLYSIISFHRFLLTKDSSDLTKHSITIDIKKFSNNPQWNLFLNVSKVEQGKALTYFNKNQIKTPNKPTLLLNQNFPEELELHIYGSKTVFVEHLLKDASAFVLEDDLFSRGLRSMLEVIKISF